MDAGLIKFGTSHGELAPAPIEPAWILEGNPVARNKFLSRSVDGGGSTYIWDCTAGRFNWHYNIDETVCVLMGSVLVKVPNGGSRLLEVGDTAFFAAGSSAEWTVQSYIRKVAFMHRPLPRPVLMAKKVYVGIRGIIRGGGKQKNGEMVPTMF
jgi:uncharacterized cupin superfamily protein